MTTVSSMNTPSGPVSLEVRASLRTEDTAQGTVARPAATRQLLCETCHGDDQLHTYRCPDCGGTGGMA
jgi:DnaJ-class molecular chaperone